jgi:hypothetical protein
VKNHPLGRQDSLLGTVLLLLSTTIAHAQPYYPSMVYGPKQTIAPGVTWQAATNPSPAQKVFIIEVDMTNPDVELMPVFKAAGNVSGSSNEATSTMALRTDALAAVNAGYYNTTNFLTNSYTEIDGVFIGGTGTSMTPESNRSVLAFSGDGQTIAKRTKLSTAFVPADSTDWNKIVDAIAGRGSFITSGGTVVTQDNEGTTVSHYDVRNPRTCIGYTASPYKAYLVAVDGRDAGVAEGMTYTELAQLMADLGIEQSVSLDGGGSTTAWVKGTGIVNTPSDGSERSVISSWAVVTGQTLDNTRAEATVTGTWTTDTVGSQLYYLDQLTTDDSAGASSVAWAPNLGQSGLYRVYAWWTSAAGRATAAPYEVVHAGGTGTVTVDQTRDGGKWNVLGAYNFNAGTGGSVTLRNTAPGTISADAIRFVRVSNTVTPSTPVYTVTGTLYQADFESNVSGDFTVSQQTAGDNAINFQYDYGTFAQQGGGHPAVIPQSPSSPGAGTRALRVDDNIAAGTTNAITATLSSIAGQSNMRITFDSWINYNGGYLGGTASTEYATFGASANPARVAMGGSAYTTAAQLFSGFFFAMTGEGGASQDYRYYDGNGVAATNVNNGSRANFLGIAAVNQSAFYSTFYPVNLYQTPGTPGKAWNRWEILVLNGQVRLAVTKPDGIEVVLCNWFTPNANATLSGLLPHFGSMDVNTGSASPASDNFVLYDNLLVQSISPVTVVGDWMLIEE